MEGDASICAPSKGIGTKEEENGVAPEEKGTFGLFVLLTTVAALREGSQSPRTSTAHTAAAGMKHFNLPTPQPSQREHVST